MGLIHYSTAEINDALDDAIALRASVPPRITYARKASDLGTLTALQTWLDTIISDMANYGVRFVNFTPTASYSKFRNVVYLGLVSKAGSADNAVVTFFRTSGAYNATYPTVMYMSKVSGTWGSPTEITA